MSSVITIVHFQGIVDPEMGKKKTLTHPHVVPNLHEVSVFPGTQEEIRLFSK